MGVRTPECTVPFMPVAEAQRYGIAGMSKNGMKTLRCVEKLKESKFEPCRHRRVRIQSCILLGVSEAEAFLEERDGDNDAISLLIDSGYMVIPHRVEDW